MRISPSTNPADVAKVEKYLREQSNGELTQIINSPIALEGKLEGFTRTMLGTAEARVIVDLARGELNRRTAGKALRVSWLSLGVSIVSAIAAVAGVAIALFTYLAHR
jgi:hypothetical protein